MVLTEMPYSLTSALRQSKKACTACLEAASGGEGGISFILFKLTFELDFAPFQHELGQSSGLNLVNSINEGNRLSSFHSHVVRKGTASLPWMLLISSRWPVLLEIMEGRTPAVGNPSNICGHCQCLAASQTELRACRTFGQSGWPEVVVVHDQLVHLQRYGLHRGFELHAAVEDEDVEAAVALQDLCDGLGHAVHVPEVQQHQL